MRKALSPKEAKSQLSRIGKTPVDLANELGIALPIVRGVLAGRLKGDRGDAHVVAVTLGLKDGVIVPRDMSIADALKAAAAQ